MVNSEQYERSVRVPHTRSHYGDTYIFMRVGIERPTSDEVSLDHPFNGSPFALRTAAAGNSLLASAS